MIAHDILVAETDKKHLHLCHVSTRGGVQLIREAKARGVRINDLNALLDADIYRYISEDNIHLSPEGIELCAAQVAQHIRDIIPYLSDKQAEMRTKNDAPVVDGAPILI